MLHQYVKWELPDIQAGFSKSRVTRDQIANTYWIIEKAREFQKNVCFLTTLKTLTVCITTTCGIFLNKWEYQTTLPASWEIYACEESTVRTRHGTTGWFQIGKGIEGCIFSPCPFNLYAENILWNTRMDEAQGEIEMAGTNNNDLTCRWHHY